MRTIFRVTSGVGGDATADGCRRRDGGVDGRSMDRFVAATDSVTDDRKTPACAKE